MRKTVTSFALLPLAIVLFFSCKKSNDVQADPIQLLMNKSWKQTAGTVSPAFMGETNFFNIIPACGQDDLLKFLAGNVLVSDDGATKCDPLDPQTITGTWSYDANAKKIVMAVPDPINFFVLELTPTTLRGTHTYDIGGTTYTYNSTFSAQ